MLKLVSNRPDAGRAHAGAANRVVSLLRTIVNAFKSAFLRAFPLPGGPDVPPGAPPVAKATVLREGAVLSEDVDANARKNIA